MKFKNKTIRIVTWGGIGDVILLTPTIREIKKQMPDSTLIVHAIDRAHYDVLFSNPNIDSLRLESRTFLSCLRLLRKAGLLPSFLRIASYGDYAPSIWVPRVHAEDIIAELVDLHISDRTPDIFLRPHEEGFGRQVTLDLASPIAIHVRSSRQSKDWSTSNWLNLISRNPDCTFIELGVCGNSRLAGTLALPPELNIRYDLAILKYCKGFLGIESCFAHAAAAFGIPGVVLFGPSSPDTWGHSTNSNLSVGMRCSPCIDVISGNDCPYGVPCMKKIEIDKVEEALRLQLLKSGYPKVSCR